MDVSQEGKVTGDLTVSGINVQVGEVDGDLRAAGESVILSGTILGYALIAGDEVEFKASVKGDVSLKAQEVEFSEDARIEGILMVYEKQAGDVKVPALVVSEDRIKRRHISEWDEATDEVELWTWQGVLGNLLKWALIITGIAALIAALVPKKLADLRRSILDQPFKNLLFGFLTISVAIGSTIVLMITGYGIFLVPVTLLITFLSVFSGYVVGAYAIGVGLLLLAKQSEPKGFKVRALAAGIGSFVAVIVVMIPMLGWLLFLAITFVGVGSIINWIFRPKFFVT
jgi:cytoskeletal protein CcmA (bactofilin family)